MAPSPSPTFHRLTVCDVEPLTDDSAAVTFEVPDDLVRLSVGIEDGADLVGDVEHALA